MMGGSKITADDNNNNNNNSTGNSSSVSGLTMSALPGV